MLLFGKRLGVCKIPAGHAHGPSQANTGPSLWWNLVLVPSGSRGRLPSDGILYSFLRDHGDVFPLMESCTRSFGITGTSSL